MIAVYVCSKEQNKAYDESSLVPYSAFAKSIGIHPDFYIDEFPSDFPFGITANNSLFEKYIRLDWHYTREYVEQAKIFLQKLAIEAELRKEVLRD